MGLMFQSIAGTERANASSISVGLLDEARALAQAGSNVAGPNVMYFETGEGPNSRPARAQRLGSTGR